MSNFELIKERNDPNQPTFTLRNRLRRGAWKLTWLLIARWTPPPLHMWRVFVLRMFGARVAKSAHVYSSVDVWAPWNLEIDSYGSLAPNVNCYNIARVSIGRKAVVSQGAHLCTGTHDYRDPAFPLTARPITVEAMAWVCAGAFVGPGVTIGEGAVLGATATAFSNLEPWTVYVGNPATRHADRPRI